MTSSNFSLPSSNFNFPSSNFNLPSSNFSFPSSNFSLPSSNFSQPSHSFSQPSPSFSQPSHSFTQLSHSPSLRLFDPQKKTPMCGASAPQQSPSLQGGVGVGPNSSSLSLLVSQFPCRVQCRVCVGFLLQTLHGATRVESERYEEDVGFCVGFAEFICSL